MSDSSYYMKNPLVLLIAISKYGGKFPNLNGTKCDMKSLVKLFGDIYGYQMIYNKSTTSNVPTYRVTQAHFLHKLDETRLLLNRHSLESDLDETKSTNLMV